MATHTHADDHAHEHPVTPISHFVFTFLALLALMLATIFASKLNLGIMNNVVAMIIAIVKATLVILIFMGVRHNTRLTWLFAGLGFVWFLLMFGILSDYFTRSWNPQPGWEQAIPK